MNHLVVCGLNYHNTPLAIREQFTIPQSCVGHALSALSKLPHVKEAVLVSTCNRTEVYAVVTDVPLGWQEIDGFFAATQAISDHQALTPNFRLLREDVALHLFRVAAGLDSMILGESQIMAQLKAAHQAALSAGTAGPVLDYLFKSALNCGKRVRTETAMGKRAVSVSSAAVELGRQLLGSLRNRHVTIIGAGKIAQICAKIVLGEPGIGSLVMLNRSPDRIQTFSKNKLPNKHKLETNSTYEDRCRVAVCSDLVIVATSAPGHVLSRQDFVAARDRQREDGQVENDIRGGINDDIGGDINGTGSDINDSSSSGGGDCQSQNPRAKDLCVIDISVPRNVDPAIGQLPGVKLRHSDDLINLVQINLAEREALVADAEAIVFETLDEFHGWQRSLLVVPTIAELREKIESIRLEQMAKSRIGRNSDDAEDGKHQIEEISRAIVNQILHHPTVQLKATRDYEILRQQAEALRTLFNLDPLSAITTNTKIKKRLSTVTGN